VGFVVSVQWAPTSQNVSTNAGFPDTSWLLVKINVEAVVLLKLNNSEVAVALKAPSVRLAVDVELVMVVNMPGLLVPVSVICQAMMSDWDNVPKWSSVFSGRDYSRRKREPLRSSKTLRERIRIISRRSG
jgi:hypothetical protein